MTNDIIQSAYLSATFTHDGVEFTVQASTATYLREILAELRGADKPAASPKPSAVASSETKPTARAASSASATANDTGGKAGNGAAASSKQETAAASPASSSEASTSASAEAGESKLVYETDVKPLVIKLGATKGRDAALAVLGKFGVEKGDKVPADKLGEFKAALEAALKG